MTDRSKQKEKKKGGYKTATITADSYTTRSTLFYSSSAVTLVTKVMGKQRAGLAAVSLWVFLKTKLNENEVGDKKFDQRWASGG